MTGKMREMTVKERRLVWAVELKVRSCEAKLPFSLVSKSFL